MANYGMLGALPPGLRGLLAAEQMAQQRGQNQLGQLGGILSLQGMMEQRQQAAAQQQELQNLIPQLTDPAARMLAQSGDLKGAIARQFPQEEAFTLGPGQQRFKGGAPVATVPDRPVMQNLPVPGQPGVTQPTWLRPGESTGVPAGGMAMPDILNPAVQAARQRIAQAGKTSVSVNPSVIVDKGQGKYAETLGGKSAEADLSQFETANKAAEGLQKVNSLIDHLKTSDARTGMGAEILKNVDRARVFLINEEAAGRRVSDTELLDSMLGSDVFPMIASLGIGARGMDTPAEREFLRQVMTGTVSMNKDTLVKMAEIRKNVAERAINKWNERVQRGEVDRFFEHSGRQKSPIAAPGAKYSGPDRRIPSGVDPKVWAVMTPEEQALWQN